MFLFPAEIHTSQTALQYSTGFQVLCQTSCFVQAAGRIVTYLQLLIMLNQSTFPSTGSLDLDTRGT